MPGPSRDPEAARRLLRLAMAYGGLSRAEAAERLGVSLSTLDRMAGIKGAQHRSPVTEEHLRLIAEAAGMPAQWLDVTTIPVSARTLEDLQAKLDRLEVKLDTRVDELDEKLDAITTALRAERPSPAMAPDEGERLVDLPPALEPAARDARRDPSEATPPDAVAPARRRRRAQ